MRYAQGSLSVNPQRDIPVLLQIRNSRFISHPQLFEFMQLSSYEYSRKSFNWRIKRLLDEHYICTSPGNFGRGARVYHITPKGLLQLEDHGHFATVLSSSTRYIPNASHAHHALELNNIHLALGRAQVLANWQGDIQTASSNTVSLTPLEKDFDAVVDVWNDTQLARFGLEYERTLKSARMYAKVRSMLESTDQIGCILYLTSGYEVTLHVAHELSGVGKRLAFATSASFKERLLDTPVITHPSQPEVVFRRLLHGMF